MLRWSRLCRCSGAFVLFFLLSFSKQALGAPPVEVRILLDLDKNPATGCTVTTLEGPFKGVEQILITIVETQSGNTASVTSVSRQLCTGVAFGAPLAVDPGDWPVGIGNGLSSTNVVETYFPAGAYNGDLAVIRMAVATLTDGQIRDVLMRTTPDTNVDITFDTSAFLEIPTLGEWGLILLTTLLASAALWKLRRQGAVLMVLAVLTICGAMVTVVWAAGILDGEINDWKAIGPVAVEGLGDAPQSADLRAFFARMNGDELCFRVDLTLTFNEAPTAEAQALTTNEDTPLPITLSGSDPNSDPLSYSIVDDPAHGVLSGTPPDIAYTPNADYNGGDTFRFQVDDGQGETDQADVTITVLPVNDPPSITSPLSVSVPENQTAVQDVQASDPDGETEGAGLTYSLTGGADQANFSILAASGVLTFVSAPDFENPDDADMDNVYEVQVTVTDGGGLTDVGTIQVTVTNDADPPSITSAATVNAPENQTAVIDVQSTDPEGETEGAGLSYSLTGGADQALFSIVPTSGVLTFISAPDFENPADANTDGIYEVEVTVSDSTAKTDVQTIAVTVTNVNEAPAITSAAAVNASENQTSAIDVQATDPEGETEGAGLTYSLTGGADQAKFSIVPSTGVLTFVSAPDFETPSDANTDGVYEVEVTVTDSGMLTDVQTIAVTVTDGNEAPSITTAAAVNAPENQTAVTDVQATDPEGESEGAGLSYSLTGGADQALFSILPATGVLTFLSAPDFENPSDANTDGVYEVEVTVADSGMLTDVQTILVTVTNANDPPVITSGAAVNAAENQTSVIDVQATDQDGDAEGAGLSYSLTGGADQAKFSIVASSGVLTFLAAPDFETPADANTDGVYEVEVTVTDSGMLTDVQTVAVTVTDESEAPTITSAAMVNAAENQTSVIDVQSTDPDGDTEGAGLSYSLTGGADQAKFSIVASTGVLTFVSVPDFETPSDANTDGVYEVEVTVTDSGMLTDVQAIQVTVTNVNEPPSITSSDMVNAAENQTSVIDVQSTDPDGDTEGAGLAYSLTGGADQAKFSIVSSTGVLTFVSAPDFETPSDANTDGVYEVEVTVTDSTMLTDVQTILVTVTDEDDPPVAANDMATVLEDSGATTIDVLANDTDVDAGPKTIQSATDPANGTVVVAMDGLSLTYQPDANYCNSSGGMADTFDYTLDPGGSMATVSVTVTCVNDAPAGADNTVSVDEDTQYVFGTADFGFADPNDTPANGLLSVIVTTLPANGSLTLSGSGFAAGTPIAASAILAGNLKFLGDPNAFGTPYTSFTFQVRDDGGTLNGGVDTDPSADTLTINVNPVNDPPMAMADTADITEEAPNVPAANEVMGNVLTNDADVDSVLSVSAVNASGANVGNPVAGTYGTITINANGTYTYALDDSNPTVDALLPGDMLTDVFNYTASDGLLTDSSTLTVTIHGADDPPTPDDDAFDFIGNTQLEVDRDTAATPELIAMTPAVPAAKGVLDGDVDPDGGSPITISGIVGCADVTAPFDCAIPGEGTVSLQADGSFSYIPLAGETDTGATFQYTLTGNPTPATVTLTRFGRVWYVDNSFAGTSDGTSTNPFKSLTSLNGASGAGDADLATDYIFVHFGDGTATGLSGGLEMEANQHLIGEHAGLSIPAALNGNPSPAVLFSAVPGNRPLLHASAGNAVSITNAVPTEIVGLALQGTADAIDLTTAAAALTGSSALTISDNLFDGAGANGLDVNIVSGTTGTLNLTLQNNSWSAAGTHTGNAVDINNASTQADLLRINFSGNTGIQSAANAMVINGGATNRTTVTALANNTISGNTAGSGATLSNLTFDAVAGGGINQVNGGTFPIGTSGNPVGASGLTLTTVTGGLTFTDLDIFAGTSGLNITGSSFTFGVTAAPGGTSSIDADNGPAVNVSGTALDLRLASLTSDTSSSGVSLTSVTGQFSAPSGSSITKASGVGTAFSVASSNLTLNYGGTLNVTSGAGVSLVNTGTSNFTGAMALSTGANAGLSASGGGTVTATDTTSTITSTTGTALNIDGTTIGGLGVKFKSISSNGAINGIRLNNTGSSGGLSVLGTGADDSGGSILASAQDGVFLNSTRDVVLNEMVINNSGQSHIDATSVVNLTLNGIETDTSTSHGILGNSITNLVISGGVFNRGGAGAEPTCNLNGVEITNLLGTSSVTGATFTRSNTIQFHVVNSATSVAPDTLTVSGTTWANHTGPCSGDHLSVAADTGGNFKLITNGSSGENNFGSPMVGQGGGIGVQATAQGSGTMQASITGVETNNNTAGVAIAASATSNISFNVFNNNTSNGTGFSGTGSVALILTCTTTGTCQGAFDNNSITHTAGTATNAMQVVLEGDGTGKVTVSNNTVSGNFQRGLQGQSRLGSGSLSLHVTNNNMTQTDAGGLQVFNLEVGASGGGTTNGLCLNLAGNTATPAGGNSAYRLFHRTGYTYQLQNLAQASTTNTADVVTWVSTTKSNIGTPVSVTIGTTAFTTSAACATPVLPTP